MAVATSQDISGKTATAGQSDESSQTLSSDLLAPRGPKPLELTRRGPLLFFAVLGQIFRAPGHLPPPPHPVRYYSTTTTRSQELVAICPPSCFFFPLRHHFRVPRSRDLVLDEQPVTKKRETRRCRVHARLAVLVGGALAHAVSYMPCPPPVSISTRSKTPATYYLPDRRGLPSPSLYGCMYKQIRTVQYTGALSIVCISEHWTGPPSQTHHSLLPTSRPLSPLTLVVRYPSMSCCPNRLLIHPRDSAGGSHKTSPTISTVSFPYKYHLLCNPTGRSLTLF